MRSQMIDRNSMSMKTNFETLDVYRLAERLADETWTIVRSWDAFARDTVGRQLVKSADSIGANLAEGSGKGTIRRTDSLCEQRGARSMKRDTGSAGRITEVF